MKEVTQKVTRSWRSERTISIFWRLLNFPSKSPKTAIEQIQEGLSDGAHFIRSQQDRAADLAGRFSPARCS